MRHFVTIQHRLHGKLHITLVASVSINYLVHQGIHTTANTVPTDSLNALLRPFDFNRGQRYISIVKYLYVFLSFIDV